MQVYEDAKQAATLQSGLYRNLQSDDVQLETRKVDTQACIETETDDGQCVNLDSGRHLQQQLPVCV